MSRPNFVLILAHQMRWNAIGALGNPDVRTPNLDALVRHGVTFSNAITTHVRSAPARASLFSGLYPREHGVRAAGDEFRPGLPCMPAIFQAAGYSTGTVGYTGIQFAAGESPFEHVAGAAYGPTREPDHYHDALRADGYPPGTLDFGAESSSTRSSHAFGAGASRLPERNLAARWVGDQATRFIQSARDPFFLFVGFPCPHPPYAPPASWLTAYDPRTLALPEEFQLAAPAGDAPATADRELGNLTEAAFRKVLACYYATVSHMDYQVGRILATLSGRGHTNNVLVFASDHGDCLGQHGPPHTHAARSCDARVRIPLIVSGVLGQRQGERDAAPVELVDLLPTALEVCGVAPEFPLAGKSLAKHLAFAGMPHRAAAYCEGDGGTRIVRDGRFKLVDGGTRDQRAFYDLLADPHERENLFGNTRTVQAQVALTRVLRQLR